MSQSDKFWRYAEAAMLGAHKSKNEAEKRAFLDLARILAQAALDNESAMTAWNVQPDYQDAHAFYANTIRGQSVTGVTIGCR